MSKNEDILLIAKCLLNDDRRAYTRLVDKYHPQIKRFFLNQTLGNVMLSDDLAQETFIKAYTYLRSFKGLSSFSTWIFRIACNVFYDFVRSQKNIDGYDSEVADSECVQSSEKIAREIDIYRAMQILKPEERAVVQLYYLEDMALNKVSEITDMPSGTVKSHLSRARQKLNEYLGKENYRYGE